MASRIGMIAVVAWMACLAACGGDSADVSREDGGAQDEGRPQGDGDGDGDGDAGDGDGDGDGDGASPTTTVATVICGGEACPVPGQELLDLVGGVAGLIGFALPLDGTLPMPCCTDDDQCGLVAASGDEAMCAPAPESDDRCPDVDFFGTMLPSCCLEAEGICGVNMSQLGGAKCEQAFGGLLNALPGGAPESCGDGSTMDSGMPDAGDSGAGDAAVDDSSVPDAAVDDSSMPEDDEDAGN